MKRYLIKGALALIAGLFITSCSHETQIDYTPEQERKANQFEEAFKEVFTQNISPNQDWGYTPAYLLQASTRVADPRSNMWVSLGYQIPVAITPTEKTLVTNYFSSEGAERYTSPVDLKEFFVQQVYKGVAEYTAGNGGKVVGGNQMDWLCAGSASMGDDHVNNFNNADGSVMLMVKSSTQRFGFKSSSDNGHVFYNFRMVDGATIDPSLAGAYYVGFDFEAAGQNPNEQVSRDKIYNDWIVKIIPGKGIDNNPNAPSNAYANNTITTKTEYFKKRYLMDYGRVFCEDLGGNYSNREDFDYNDVVFDAKLWKEEEWQKVTVTIKQVITTETTIYKTDNKGKVVVDRNGEPVVSHIEKTEEIKTTEETPVISQVEGVRPAFYAEICLLATGATLPVRVGGSNAIEVHKALGDYSVDCMINTFDQYTSDVKNGFGYHETAEPVTLDWIDVTSIYSNKDIYSISDIPVYVRWQGIEATAVQSVKGSAPERFTIREKINWASERANMNVGYPAFTSWVESNSPFWTGVSANTQGLYQGYPSPSAGLTFDNSDVNAEHILNVHYTKYDVETIDGDFVTIDKDNDGNIINPENDDDDDDVPTGSATWNKDKYKSGDLISTGTLKGRGIIPAKGGVTITIIGNSTKNIWGTPQWSVNVTDKNGTSIVTASDSKKNGATVSYNNSLLNLLLPTKATITISLSAEVVERLLVNDGGIRINYENFVTLWPYSVKVWITQ